MKNFNELLYELDACNQSIIWAGKKTIEEVVQTCHRGDWLLWLADELCLSKRKITLAKARCAKTIIHLLENQTAINAIHKAEEFGLGKCSKETLKIYANKVNALLYSYNFKHIDYNVRLATNCASYAADYDTCSSNVANISSKIISTAAIHNKKQDYIEVRIKNQEETADICRKILGKLIIKKVNSLLKK